MKPGPEFKERYYSGIIAMEKIEDTTYRLTISQVQQSDSGEIYCQADEWIQDPDRSWFRICHRNTTSSNIEVKALGKIYELDIGTVLLLWLYYANLDSMKMENKKYGILYLDFSVFLLLCVSDTGHEVGSFDTQIRVLNGDLEEGDKMEIHCNIEAQDLPGHFFSITWLRNNMEVAQIGPSGVLSVANTHVKRANNGELRMVKKGDRIFILTIQPVTAEDRGMYQCRALQEEKMETGSFIKGESQLSHEETVRIRAKGQILFIVIVIYHWSQWC